MMRIYCSQHGIECNTVNKCMQHCTLLPAAPAKVAKSRPATFQPTYEIEHTRVSYVMTPRGWVLAGVCIVLLCAAISFIAKHI